MKMTWFSGSQIKMSIRESDRWYVQLDGRPVAIIENPTDADMFWFTWDVVPLGETPIPTDLWDYSTDSRRSFRHLETDELDPVAFPGGKALLESGRVLLRGPLRNRGCLFDDQYRAPKSRIRRLLQWIISLPRHSDHTLLDPLFLWITLWISTVCFPLDPEHGMLGVSLCDPSHFLPLPSLQT
jgi:hypothetical protein